MTADANIILASTSPFRQAMLENAGVAFTARAPAIDERSVEAPLLKSDLDAPDIALVLANAKAAVVSANAPDAYVIGCDQTLALDGELLHKPADMEAARRRLLALSARTHQLHSAAVIVKGDETLWSHVETCHIRFRKLDPGFVGRHLADVGEAALSSVGAYQIEGRGAQLIEAIKGDFFAIVGLPLLPLLAQLRQLNQIDH